MEEYILVTYWIITSLNESYEMTSGIETISQKSGIIHASKALRALDLIKNITAKKTY